MTEGLKTSGRVNIKHFDGEGNLIGEYNYNNLVVTTGLNHIAGRLGPTASAPTQMSHMSLGSGQTAPAAGDTILGTELTGRQALAVAGGTVSGNQVTYSATFAAGVSTGTIYEAGIFNNATKDQGVMLCRTTFGLITKGAADSITVTWQITIAAA